VLSEIGAVTIDSPQTTILFNIDRDHIKKGDVDRDHIKKGDIDIWGIGLPLTESLIMNPH
jgi:hypothetical protein